MKISDLDEYEGLTVDMVRTWLDSHGCARTPGHWDHPTSGYRYKDGDYGGPLWEGTLFQIAYDFGLSIQGLLREINPRLRKGLPSLADIIAHGALTGNDWLCSRNVLHAVKMVHDVSEHIQMVDGFDVYCASRPADLAMMDDSSYWPCDAHGNKVRWPTGGKP